jgi:peptidyl-tRNA hydrolase, PTH1 family
VPKDETGWLVVGLGNPGEEYAATRHNVGFRVAEELALRSGKARWRKRWDGTIAETEIGGSAALLLRPMTFMNLSGRCVTRAVRHLGVPLEHLLVVHDDVDLEFGQIKVKQGGGDAGHRGVQSVIAALGGKEFPRLRVGVGRGAGDTADWVLEEFSRAEREALDELIGRAAQAAEVVVAQGVAAAMNRFNTRRRDA